MKNRILSFIVTFSIMLSLLSSVSLPVNAETITGDCGKEGENIVWTLDKESGLLTVTGSGEMKNYLFTKWGTGVDTAFFQEGITSIGDYSFFYCESLRSVSLPSTLTRIGSSAFSCCFALTNIIIPDGVTSLGSNAFSNCKSLASINIPNSVTSIGCAAFEDCGLLKAISIPDSVSKIGYSAFSGCSEMASLSLGTGITDIDFWAFANCPLLESVTIPASVSRIGSDAFKNCTGLTDITILNESCRINEDPNTLGIPDSTVIYGYTDSTAEKYANKNGYTFVSIGSAPNADNSAASPSDIPLIDSPNTVEPSDASSEMQTASVRVSQDGEMSVEYNAILRGGDIYFSAEDYGKITRYSVLPGDKGYGYQLGEKLVVVNNETGDLKIPVLGYEGNIGPVIVKDGTYYFSASSLLPWLNVACYVEDGILEIIPDGMTIWEAMDGLTYDDYLFNLSALYDDSLTSTAGLAAMSVFDTLINLRWDRLIPADGSITGALNNASLYDYNCYITAFSDLGANDDLSSEKVEGVLKTVVKVNKGIDKVEKTFGFDEKKAQLNLDNYLWELGADQDTISLFYNISDTWQKLREGIMAYGKVSKYLSIFSAIKSYELILKTDNEYRTYLAWLADQDSENSLIPKAATNACNLLDRNKGVLISTYMHSAKGLLDQIPESALKAISNNVMDEALQGTLKTFSDGFFGSLGTYMGIAKIVYGAVLPVSSGFKGMAKANTIESIQDYCWSLTYTLKNEPMTQDNVLLLRQSYMAALHASRMNFGSYQDTMDVKLLGLIPIYNGKGLLDYQFDRIDAKLAAFIASADATENDSIEGKQEFSASLIDLFGSVSSSILDDASDNHAAEDVLPLHELMESGYWYLYSTQSSACNEYEFDGQGCVRIRYIDYMGEEAKYITFLEEVHSYWVDEERGLIYIYDTDINTADIWAVDSSTMNFYKSANDYELGYFTWYLWYYPSKPSFDELWKGYSQFMKDNGYWS